MATYNIYDNAPVTAESFFPVGVAIGRNNIEGNGRDYTFTVGGEARTVRVYWNSDTSNIITIGLFGADDKPLAEIIDAPVSLAAFEALWLSTAQSSYEVFAFFFSGDDRMEGGDAENTFAPGLGNDEVFGGDSSVNDYDYVNYAFDDRQFGITVDFVDGDASDDVGKVTSRGGPDETDILRSINGVYATAHADLLIGDNHDNEFFAGFGNDTIHGGDGPAENFDLLSYRGGAGVRTQGITVTFSDQGEGTVTSTERGGEIDTFTGIEAVYGTDHDDHFKGAAGFQRFRGFGGNDIFDGGAGSDEVDYRNDAAEIAGKAGIFVDLSSVNGEGAVTVAGANGDVDTLIGIERIRGTRNNDTLGGSDDSNRLRGDAGDDDLVGRGGDDRLDGGTGWDVLDGGAGNDILIGGIGRATDEDYFIGGSGNDTIHGGEVGQADDWQTNWNDINYNVDGIAAITVTFDESVSQYGSGTVVKRDGAGNVIGTDTFFSIHAIKGTNGDDAFIGGSTISQRFIGYAGADLFDGSKGVNEVDYRAEARAFNRQVGMTIDLGTGFEAKVVDATGLSTDTLISIERIRGTEFDNAISGNNRNNRLRGDAGNDRLIGRDGDDRLEGSAGWDFLDGGAGNDILIGGLGAATDEDSFLGSFGDDTIYGGETAQDDDANTNWNDLSYGSGDFTGIEVQFTAGGRYGSGKVAKKVGGDIVGTDQFYNIHVVRGTSGADKFIGAESSVAQRFIGLAGADIFDGTNGINEIDYRADYRAAPAQLKKGMEIDLRGGDTVTVTDLSGAADRLTKIERIRGTEADDRIYGNGLNNRLRGDNGNDLVAGGAGDDQIEGGAGTDTAIYSGNRSNYHVTNNGTSVTIADQRGGGEGTDIVTDVGVFNFGGTVLNLAEVLNHGSAITLTGGMVVENSATGVDIGTVSVADPDALSTHSYTLVNDAGGRFQLASDNKTIEVKNGALLDYEQAMSHTVVVRATDNFGKSIDQTLTIVLQDVAKETTTGTSGGDTLSGGSSTDNLSGGAGDDNLNGGGGKDKINGGTGNDRIIGGSGQDSLSGGLGKDVFVFANKDTGTSKGTADYITDFSSRGAIRSI